MKHAIASLIFLVMFLSACADSNENANALIVSDSAPQNRMVEPVEPVPQNPESNLLDACQALPKEEVERIMGQAVKSAELSRAVEGTSTTAALSQCTYQTAGGQQIELFLRRSPTGDNTPEAIQEVRETMKKVTLKEVEEMGGVGKTAFWVSPLNQLHVFAGEKVYLYLTMRNFKTIEDAKTKSAELARRTIGAMSAQ